MEHHTTLDTILNKSQPGSGSNTNTDNTMKASARNMDPMKGGTTSTAVPAKDDGLTCYKCTHVGHISRNYPSRDWMQDLLEYGLVGKDSPKAKSGLACIE